MPDDPDELEAVLGAATRRLLELVATSRQVGPQDSTAVVMERIVVMSPVEQAASLFAAVMLLDTLGVARG